MTLKCMNVSKNVDRAQDSRLAPNLFNFYKYD